ncbi:DUF3606 domain-containing protein [Methylobacterium terricola]|uniref:DUF3606 domain-containing protein n=1 Tax=Methylobacterium terricola TaxID=2583531 RepID=A0A5C4L9S1_9HYPH|nr:DUF3606 domain-containing protein [Methylobacterium terricola]TNC07650.1 DUF3606 domain-containing protein [Methylobacterium terricola]
MALIAAVPTDRQRHIDIYSPEDRAYWCERFGVSDDALRQAVKLTSTRASTVAAHLGIAL